MRELNPVENIWQFMRDNWFSTSNSRSYENLVDHSSSRLEQARRSTLENHVHRIARLDARVLIMGLV